MSEKNLKHYACKAYFFVKHMKLETLLRLILTSVAILFLLQVFVFIFWWIQ